MNIILIIVLGLLSDIKVAFQSLFSKKFIKSLFDNLFFWLIVFIIPAITFIPIGFALNQFSVELIIYSLIMGALTVIFQIFYSYAMKHGPVGITVLTCSLACIIPTVFSLIAYNEVVTVCKIIAFVCFVISLIFNFSKDPKQKANPKWVFSIIMVALANGATGIVQKIFSKTPSGGGTFAFIGTYYAFAFIFLAIIVTILALRKQKITFKISLPSLGLPILVGALLCGCNFLQFYCISHVDGSIYFPLYSGICICFAIITGRILYKEKLTLMKWLALIFGLTCVILINF